MDAIAQAKLIHRQFPKHIGIAEAAPRPFDDFLGDKSRRRIVNNFQMQRIAGLDESSGRPIPSSKSSMAGTRSRQCACFSADGARA
jgi:hypothetical protein